MADLMTDLGTFVPDKLLGGSFSIVRSEVTIASNAGALLRGSVLGKVTATGKYVLSASAAEDGSQTPDCILAKDVDATSGEAVGVAYLSGEFVKDALTLGEGHTVTSILDGLRDKNIYLVDYKEI